MENGGYHCPRDNTIVSFDQCNNCEWVRRHDDYSCIWCRYNIGRKRPQRPEDELKRLLRQAEDQEQKMNRAYRRGHTRIGDNLAIELGHTQKRIRQIKAEEKGTET